MPRPSSRARALVVHGARPRVRGAAYVVDLGAEHRSLQFDNTEPDAAQQWYLTQDEAWSYWADAADEPRAGQGRGDRLRHRRQPSRVRRPGARRHLVRRRQLAHRHAAVTARSSPARSPRTRVNNIGIAGIAFNAKLLVAKVVAVRLQRLDLRRGATRSPGRSNHGARVINLSIGGNRDPERSRRSTRSRRPRRRRSSTRGRRACSSSRRSGTARRRRGRPGRTPTTRRRSRTCSASRLSRQSGNVPDYSNRDKQFVDIARAGRPDLLDDPAQPRRRLGAGLQRARFGVLGLRPVGVQGRDRHLVRGAAGLRGRRAAARRRPEALERASSSGCSSGPPRTRRPRRAVPPARSAATRSPAGECSTSRRALSCSRTRRACPPSDTLEPTTTPARRRIRSERCRGRSSRRSTTGTTRSTCTRSSSPRASELFARLGLRSPVANTARPLEARDADHERLARARCALNRPQAREPSNGQQRLALRRSGGGAVLPRGEGRRPDAGRRPLRALGCAPQGGLSRLLAARRRERPGASSPGCRRRACRGGTSFVTTAPAPTNASSPISTAGQMNAPAPTRAPRRIVGPSISSWRRSVRPMKLSFEVTTQGAMKTCSSSVE